MIERHVQSTQQLFFKIQIFSPLNNTILGANNTVNALNYFTEKKQKTIRMVFDLKKAFDNTEKKHWTIGNNSCS